MFLKKSLLFSVIRNFDNRPTYDRFFEVTKEYPNDINILANADIYFNDTIKLIQGIGKKECYALTRWEEEGEKIVPFETKHSYNKQAHAKHSQDVWVFNGSVNIKGGNFHLGRPGCDNRIACIIHENGYSVTNPSNKLPVDILIENAVSTTYIELLKERQQIEEKREASKSGEKKVVDSINSAIEFFE